MTLSEMKKKTLRLIEAVNPANPLLTDDTDLQAKINDVINQIQYEAARMKKISAYTTIDVLENEDYTLNELSSDIYQLIKIKDVPYERTGDIITFTEAGTAKIYYYKYPTQITSATPDTYLFELDPDILEVMPYGIAADLLKSDPSEQYGGIYEKRYTDLMSRLDSRRTSGTIIIEGGIE